MGNICIIGFIGVGKIIYLVGLVYWLEKINFNF